MALKSLKPFSILILFIHLNALAFGWNKQGMPPQGPGATPTVKLITCCISSKDKPDSNPKCNAANPKPGKKMKSLESLHAKCVAPQCLWNPSCGGGMPGLPLPR